MKDQSNSNELLFQRCVDGELQEIEQVDLIQHLDNSADQQGWRSLALQFMENQFLNQYFSQDCQFCQNVSEVDNARLDVPAESYSNETSQDRSRQMAFPVKMVLSVAAGLLLGLSLNYLNSDSLAPNVTSSKGPLKNSNDNVVFSGSSQGNTRVVSNPGPPSFEVYEFPEGEMVFHEEIVPPEVSRYLEEKGYVIERRSRAFRLPLENGREVIIPSDTIFVRQSHR